MKIYDLEELPQEGVMGVVEMLERDVAKEVRRQRHEEDSWGRGLPLCALIAGAGAICTWLVVALQTFEVM